MVAAKAKAKAQKTGAHPLGLENELVSDIIEGIEDFKAGRGKSFDSKNDLMAYLKSL
ncbi:MAG: hypothetical protein ACXQT2_06070 [Methanotrichaceae archaeon]